MSLNLDEKLGVCSWSLQAENAADLAQRVSACELPFVQLALNPLARQPEQWADVNKHLAAAGVSIRSGMFGCVGEDYSSLESIRKTGGLVPEQTWPENQKIIENAIRTAESLGLRLVSTHAGFIPDADDKQAFERLVERIRWVTDRFKSVGLTLLLETGQETASVLETFLRKVDAPNLGVNFDPANMILYDKGDPITALQRLLPYVGQVHIKDAVRTTSPGTWGQEVAVGEGDVDWPAFLRVLDESSFTGDLVIERERGQPHTRMNDIRTARQLLQDWMAQAT
ncbi:sugar phosphate isomerase/epimerase family protein [Phycisphaerales bacterium AB-hyl4]|uniref:Sugar phosphate isomerase/epimerase family protein n=1 Tax=Natronomicrosphaera hydrolytica TaxID=3242702 RepID=A0ABV4U1H4_9BACT